MLTLFDQLRRLTARKAGRLCLLLSVWMLALSGARFEVHAHAVVAEHDVHAVSDHHATGNHVHDHDHDLTLDDLSSDWSPADPAQSSPHVHELGALAALPVAHFLPQLGVRPRSQLPVPEPAVAETRAAAPPIRPPIS